MHRTATLPCRDFYDRVAAVYDQAYAHPSNITGAQTRWLARSCPKGRLLDLGCGTGRMLAPLAEAGFRPLGLDNSPAMLARARRALPGADLILADARRSLPLADASCDTVISLHATLIHLIRLRDLQALAAEAHRVLKPGGALVAEFPHPTLFPRESATGCWLHLAEGFSCRRLDTDLFQMRLEDQNGLTTLVRAPSLEDLPHWLDSFAHIHLHPGFRGGKFSPHRGDAMVVCAWK